jgi:DNA-binding response OmpR family regulator
MHILILAPTHNAAEELKAVVGDVADRCTVAATWPNALSCLEEDRPDLVVIQRTALTRMEPTTVLNLIEPGRWPPLIIVDVPTTAIRDGALLTRRLVRTAPPSYQIGDLHIDTRKKRVGFGERWVTLPPLQYRLLLTLAQHTGEVVSYQDLLRAVWGHDGDDNEARELLKVHIRQIRRRLNLDPERQRYIRSVRGFGYMLISPEDD